MLVDAELVHEPLESGPLRALSRDPQTEGQSSRSQNCHRPQDRRVALLRHEATGREYHRHLVRLRGNRSLVGVHSMMNQRDGRTVAR
jgi:hypothetical protein